MTEAAHFTRKKCHKKHLRLKPTTKIKVSNCFLRFNKEAMRWLVVWMDAQLMFIEHHNRCMSKARAAAARFYTFMRMHAIIPE
jgi:hypothetical protein